MAWAIGRERADLICEYMMREEPEAFGGSGSCLLAVARYARLGTFVDCSGQPQVEAAHCHPDAEAAYMAAAAVLSTGELYLVRRFAQAGSRPSWRPFHVVTPGPELVFKDGKWKARVRRPGGGVLTLSAMTTGPMAGVLYVRRSVCRPWFPGEYTASSRLTRSHVTRSQAAEPQAGTDRITGMRIGSRLDVCFRADYVRLTPRSRHPVT